MRKREGRKRRKHDVDVNLHMYDKKPKTVVSNLGRSELSLR